MFVCVCVSVRDMTIEDLITDRIKTRKKLTLVTFHYEDNFEYTNELLQEKLHSSLLW